MHLQSHRLKQLAMLILLVSLMTSAPSFAKGLDWSIGERDGEAVALASVEKAFSPSTVLRVRDFVGHIELQSADVDHATMEFVLGGIKHADESDLKKWSKRLELDVRTGKKQWEVVGDRDLADWNHRPWYLEVTITLPNGAEVDASSVLGGMELHDYTGDVRFETITGGIYAHDCVGDLVLLTQTGGFDLINLTGVVDARTQTGGITIEELHASNPSHVETQTGGVTVDNTYGTLDVHISTGGINIRGHHDDLDISTGTGGIEIRGLSGLLKASTSTGSVKMWDLGGELTGLDLSTGTGPIDVAIGSELAADIEVTIRDDDGKDNLRSDFPITEDHESRSKYTALIQRNGGGVPINLTTAAGWIHIEEDWK
jgi:DUF4097 and DUF4098 domain-containing protein YvlB